MKNVYVCKDGRTRVYLSDSKKVVSYPRILMEEKLGRKLKSYEQVHHIDENPLNNNLKNLELAIIGEHQRNHSLKYHDKIMICPWCGKEFIWTSIKQRNFYANLSRKKRNKNSRNKPFCSKSCIGSYSRKRAVEEESSI